MHLLLIFVEIDVCRIDVQIEEFYTGTAGYIRLYRLCIMTVSNIDWV